MLDDINTIQFLCSEDSLTKKALTPQKYKKNYYLKKSECKLRFVLNAFDSQSISENGCNTESMNEDTQKVFGMSLDEFLEAEGIKHMYESLGLLRALRSKRTHQAVIFGFLAILTALGMSVGGAGMIFSLILSEVKTGEVHYGWGVGYYVDTVAGFGTGFGIFTLFLVFFIMIMALWILKEVLGRMQEKMLLDDINKEGVFELW